MIRQLTLAKNNCPHCNGTGKKPHPSVGFELHVGDIVEDHCGLRVRIDDVWHEDNTIGWGTTLNAPDSWVLNVNHSNHRVETDNDLFTESEWTKLNQ